MFVSAIPNDVAGQPIAGGEFNVDKLAAALHNLRASLRAGDFRAADAAFAQLQAEAGAAASAQVENDLEALASALSLSNVVRAENVVTLLQHDLAQPASVELLTLPLDVVTLDAASLASANNSAAVAFNPLATTAPLQEFARIVATPVEEPIAEPTAASLANSVDASAIALEIASSLAGSFSATYVANVAEAEEEERVEFERDEEADEVTVVAAEKAAKLNLQA